MLHAMQQSASSSPSPTSPSFAGLLAALAQPPGDAPNKPSPSANRTPFAWNDDDLADDVATLSYESALKAHARYRPTDQSLTQLPDPAPFSFDEAPPSAPQPAPRIAAHPAPRTGVNPEPKSNRLPSAPVERNLKDASITLRMSQAECAQLHRRAAEAGLTVSAYLRSCTFEAESLRAMVKDTLAQLRSVTAQAKPATPAPQPRRSGVGKLARLFTCWLRSPRVARA
jgi:hypothetical protein